MAWTLALSVADQIERVGAYVGLASFFGLAALTILYFSQARELKRLRDWAGRAPERARELEERVIAQADAAQRAEAAPAEEAEPAAEPAEAPAAEPVPAAPAQPARAIPAVALTAAAAFAPAKPAAEPVQAPPAEPQPEPQAVPATNGDRAAEPATALQPAAAPNGAEAPASPPVAVPAAATVAARGATTTTRPAGPSTVRAGGPGRPGGPALPPRRPAPAPRRPAPAAAAPRTRTPHRRRNWLLGVFGVLLAVGAIGAGVIVFAGDDEPLEPNSTGAPAPEEGGGAVREQPETDTPADGGATPAETTVAVLNGTTTTGLAATLAQKVEEVGFDRGTTGNYTDQQRPTSVVMYASGFRTQAEEVARALRITDVERLDGDTQRLASGDEVAEVVVIAGTDQTP